MSPKRGVKTNTGTAKSDQSSRTSPLSDSHSVTPPSEEALQLKKTPSPPTRRSPRRKKPTEKAQSAMEKQAEKPSLTEPKPTLKIQFDKRSAGFEPKPTPAKKAPKASKRKLAETSRGAEALPGPVEEVPVKRLKLFMKAAATEAADAEEGSSNAPVAADERTGGSKKPTAAADNRKKISQEISAATAKGKGAPKKIVDASANHRVGSGDAIAAADKGKEISKAMITSNDKGMESSKKIEVAGTKTKQSSDEAISPNDDSGMKSSSTNNSSDEVSPKSASGKQKRKATDESPETPLAKKTKVKEEPAGTATEDKPKPKAKAKTRNTRNSNKDGAHQTPSPVNSKSSSGSSNKRSRWDGMTVEEALSIPLNEEDKGTNKRVRANRPLNIDVNKYTSVLDKLPSKQELAEAAKAFPDQDVDLMGEMKDEMQDARIKREMEYLLSLDDW
ncbi:hypothetical protein MMC10_006424 [Thelotrema lepadinum]|nr:hypothetical protein [Thelotrema lepadinum]